MFERFHHELRKAVLFRLQLAHAPQFYDLPSMEVALASLVHVSANRIKCANKQQADSWPTGLSDKDEFLLKAILRTLLEVRVFVICENVYC